MYYCLLQLTLQFIHEKLFDPLKPIENNVSSVDRVSYSSKRINAQSRTISITARSSTSSIVSSEITAFKVAIANPKKLSIVNLARLF